VKIVIVGCGRVGASAAESWDAAGHDVVVLDISTRAFERLPPTFGGEALRGDGTDEDVLRRAGAEGADILLAVTEGDNRNVMSAQLASEALSVGQVIAKINDPLRAAAYAELGIATVCRTGLMLDAINAHIGFPPSGLAGMLAASGHHSGPEHGLPPATGNEASPAADAPSPTTASVASDATQEA
jgi:trk system potassium uptake protein TrkA